jgi:glycosyltransferase involved in cell wall biosynthesis
MMAAAKPIILAAEGEAEELIASSGAGVIVPPDEPEQFASAILAMHENAEGAREMGLRGLAYVREKFEWSKLVGNWLKQLSAAEVAQNAEVARVGVVEDRFSKVS